MRYKNPYQRKIFRGFSHFLLWRLGYYNDKELPAALPKGFSFPNPLEAVDPAQPRVTWVNHSTFWIRAYGKSILLDPIWNQRCSPLNFVGPKRLHSPDPSLNEIDSVDVVIVSHNHYDHLDRYTVRLLHERFPEILWVIPMGVCRWFRRRFPKTRIQELSWWESIEHEGMRLTAVPAQHFSGRGLFDRNRTLWMGCVVEFNEGKRIYFAGDTGYNAFDFKSIGEKFSKMDLSLIPIGVYCPRAFMKPVHVNPFESIQIHNDVKSKLSVASHFGTFRLSSEEIDRPPYDLFCALERSKIPPKNFRVLKPGQTLNW
ncbi:MAG: MBL fold metallo-hydrolase [Chlamydiales bacterium]|nr:MBL fold metallo-hydrolase [Chlamydiales bacterium]